MSSVRLLAQMPECRGNSDLPACFATSYQIGRRSRLLNPAQRGELRAPVAPARKKHSVPLTDYDARIVQSPGELARYLRLLTDADVDIFHVSTRRLREPAVDGDPRSLARSTRELSGRAVMAVGSASLDRPHQSNATGGHVRAQGRRGGRSWDEPVRRDRSTGSGLNWTKICYGRGGRQMGGTSSGVIGLDRAA